MKIIKVFFKIFIISVILAVVVIAGIGLYVKFYGKDIIADTLSKMLGTEVKFDNISLNLDQYIVNFKGFTIPSEIGFDERSVFNAEKFSLSLNKEKFEKEKKVAFDHIIIKKGQLNIVRNRKGEFNISSLNNNLNLGGSDRQSGVAYAQEAGAANIYNFAKTVKRIDIQDSVINFKDHYVPQGPFAIRCDEFNVTITNSPEKEATYNAIPMNCAITFKIPGRYKRGDVALKVDASILKSKVDMDMELHTANIDLMQFLPYFNSYTPFSFNEGIFSSVSRLTVKENWVDSLTEILFHRLGLLIDPGMENARFLETSVNRLAPYLMSGEGEIIFDFVIKGPLDNPRIGLGPKVKFAIGQVVVEEVGNIIQQLQKLRR